MIDFRIQPKGFNQGIYEMSFEQYAAIPALNSSKLKQLRRTPAHFRAAIEGPPKEITAMQRRTFDRGKAFDIYILDGGLKALMKKVAIEPSISRQKKEYRIWKESAQARGKLILSQSEYFSAIAMARCAHNKMTFSDIFSSGHAHKVVIWRDPATGIWCKAEIDWIMPDGTVVDLKTTKDAGFWFFNRNARRLGYANQGAFYLSGLTVATGYIHDRFLLASVEVDLPYESQVFRPSSIQLEEAKDENASRMEVLAECLEKDEWPGYPDFIMDLESGQYYDDEFTEEEMEEEANGF